MSPLPLAEEGWGEGFQISKHELRSSTMFWPVILPFQITCGALIVAVVLLTVYASPKSGTHFKSLCFYSLVALVAFIPSCTGIMMVIDVVRFGDFQYA